jgi:GDP-L-fucose synthase
MMDKNSKIYIAGHGGLLGNALYQYLQSNGYTNLITRTHEKLDLTKPDKVEIFFAIERPEYVFNCAGIIGGIKANSIYPVDFLYDNTMIQFNIIKCCHKFNAKKLLNVGSNCAYPKDIMNPIKESDLLSGYLEETSEPFSIAKIAGIKLCQAYNKQYGTNYISAMFSNLYGIGEKFDKENSHLIPALIMKIHEAKINDNKSVVLWGNGKPKRELLYIDDAVDSCVFLMNNYDDNEIINVGTGFDLSIKEIATVIADVVGYTGDITFDISKPNGTMRKLLDSSKINNLGWKPEIDFVDGIKNMYDWWAVNGCNSTNKSTDN